jgi:hypothetical protein
MRLVKTDRWPETGGSFFRCSWISVASPSRPLRMSVWPSARCTFTPAGTTITRLTGELPLHLRRTGARRCKNTPSITQFDGCHPVRRSHQMAQGGEWWHFIRRAVGERHRCQLGRLSNGQTELDPPARRRRRSAALLRASRIASIAWMSKRRRWHLVVPRTAASRGPDHCC